MLDRVEDELVEGGGPGARDRYPGGGERTANPATASVSSPVVSVPTRLLAGLFSGQRHGCSPGCSVGSVTLGEPSLAGSQPDTLCDLWVDGPAHAVRLLAFALVSPLRRCTRTACGQPAVATLTYVYAESTAVLGPLATYAEPHCYDLCARHSARLTAPLGWEVVRLEIAEPAGPTADDLEALADAVREAARPAPAAQRVDGLPTISGNTISSSTGAGVGGPSQGRRGHLRVLQPPTS